MGSTDAVEQLLSEFRLIGLDEGDARRSTFCALAYWKGWNTACIARYMGISRARVGQRIERLRKHTESSDMPTLTTLFASALEPDNGPAMPVGFDLACWADKEFATGLIRQIAA